MTSILFFFNPGVLWLSSLISAERENCCDDMAITHTDDKVKFVEALISVKQHALSSPALAMNFLGQKTSCCTGCKGSSTAGISRLTWQNCCLLFVAWYVRCCYFLVPVQLSPANSPLRSSASGSVGEVFVKCHFLHRSKSNNKDQSRQPGLFTRAGSGKQVSYRERNKIKQPVSGNTALTEPVRTQYPTVSAESDQVIAISEYRQHLKDLTNAELDRIQAEKDRLAADRDRIQAEKDRVQAELDRRQAVLDRIQADKDRAQADLDRKQADKDRSRPYVTQEPQPRIIK
ncbi:MAG: hypothetical protein IPP99_10710 [Chitinophagaceae bacterium]|nr:hypothetical protein [Chitinophagaceae bacterium]